MKFLHHFHEFPHANIFQILFIDLHLHGNWAEMDSATNGDGGSVLIYCSLFKRKRRSWSRYRSFWFRKNHLFFSNIRFRSMNGLVWISFRDSESESTPEWSPSKSPSVRCTTVSSSKVLIFSVSAGSFSWFVCSVSWLSAWFQLCTLMNHNTMHSFPINKSNDCTFINISFFFFEKIHI